METKEINKIVGKKIAILLEINRMTQSELARRVGYSNHTAISQIVRGAKGPGKAMMTRIAEELNVPEPFLSSHEEYSHEEWEAILKFQAVLKRKDEQPAEYQYVMKFFDKL